MSAKFPADPVYAPRYPAHAPSPFGLRSRPRRAVVHASGPAQAPLSPT